MHRLQVCASSISVCYCANVNRDGYSVGAVSAAAVVYRADPTNVAAAQEKYKAESAKC